MNFILSLILKNKNATVSIIMLLTQPQVFSHITYRLMSAASLKNAMIFIYIISTLNFASCHFLLRGALTEQREHD